MAFQPIELKAHRRSEVLSALPTRSRPHPLQHLHRVVVADGRRNTSATAASCPPPRPACHPHDLIKDPALAPRRSLHIRLGVPRRDLGSRIHRKLVFHTQQCSPLRGHSYVRHGKTFAGTFAEFRRLVDLRVRSVLPLSNEIAYRPRLHSRHHDRPGSSISTHADVECGERNRGLCSLVPRHAALARPGDFRRNYFSRSDVDFKGLQHKRGA